jgi:predicted O-methyltransferase YrrM
VGALLRTLARSVGDGRVLELGTGPGTSTAWIIDGMTAGATLTTVELDPAIADVARSVLGDDPRISFRVGDGSSLLREFVDVSFDLIFADTWPGKYWDLDLALDLLAPGGVYVVDDMLPQPNWPDDHAEKVTNLLQVLDEHPELIVTRMAWSTGVVMASRR